MAEIVKKMPSWFDLEKYTLTTTFSAEDWWYQLYWRYLFYEALNGHDTEASRWMIGHVMDEIIAHGVLRKGGPCFSQNLPALQKNASVKSLSLYEVYCISDKIQAATMQYQLYQETKEHLKDWNASALLDERYKKFNESNLDDYLLKDPEFLAKTIHMTINLGATDEQILTEMKAYLKLVREQYSLQIVAKGEKLVRIQSGRFGKDIFNTMVKLRVLPYIDIRLVEMLTDQKIFRLLLYKKLYPDETKASAEKRLRDLMPKYFNVLMDREVLNRLALYAKSQ